MQTITPTEARKKLFSLIEDVNTHGAIAIKGKKGDAVLVSKDEWGSLQETLYLYSVPGMVESIKEAAAEPLEEAVSYEEVKAMLDEDDD